MRKLAIIALILAFTVGCGANNDETNQVNGAPEESKGDLNEAINESNETIDEAINNSGLDVGAIPPSLGLETLDGEIFDQALIEGKKVIINFWATWCEPCRLEIPDMLQLVEENQDDLVVVAVNFREKQETVQNFVEEFGMQDFHVLLDTTGELSEQFQVLVLPTSYFLNTDGTIAYKHPGYMDYGQFVHAYDNLK